jgi:transposase InsO family protein
VNHKRVERIWRDEGLKVTKKQPKRRRLWLNNGSCIRLRPTHSNHVWSFNGQLRDELLEREAFDTLLEAKVLIERWRQHYNTIRPHSALGCRPPAPEARQPCAVASAPPRQPHSPGLLEGETLT